MIARAALLLVGVVAAMVCGALVAAFGSGLHALDALRGGR